MTPLDIAQRALDQAVAYELEQLSYHHPAHWLVQNAVAARRDAQVRLDALRAEHENKEESNVE